MRFIMRRSRDQVNVIRNSAVPKQGWLVRAYIWACEVLYHELAWWYDVVSWCVSAGQWRRWQRGIWQEVGGRRVLEIGCGTGAMMVDGASRGVVVTGVDRSSEMLAVAQARLMKHGVTSCALLQGDGRVLPFGDGTFDGVFATFPAGYIFEQATLTELHRVLASGGRMVLLGIWVDFRLGALSRWIPLFYGRPSNRAMAAMLARVELAGFRAHWVEQDNGLFAVGVLVAER